MHAPFLHLRLDSKQRLRWGEQVARFLPLLWLLIQMSLLPHANATEAEVRFQDATQGTILFYGRIDRPSVLKLTDLLSRWQKSPSSERPTVMIESPGGDVDAALIAGRALRQARATIFVNGSPDKATCSSSCIFLVAGAVERYFFGGLAIHNFFVVSEELTYDEVTKTRRRLEASIRSFLVEMNVSPQLYDRMLSVPPQRLRLLTEQERDDLGLGSTDPTFQDFRHGQQATRHGTDKTTYIARLGTLIAICGQPPSSPPLPDLESLTSAKLKASRDRYTRYEAQRERLDELWDGCKKDVLTGRRVK